MYQRILVATDGSDTSDRAVREAVGLAKEGRSSLRIVHVLDPITFSTDTPQGFTGYEAALRAAGEQILGAAGETADKAGVACETQLLEVEEHGRRVADEIARDAQDWEAELIVIGTHGRRGLSRFFLGSVAESVIRIAPAPVLLIRGA